MCAVFTGRSTGPTPWVCDCVWGACVGYAPTHPHTHTQAAFFDGQIRIRGPPPSSLKWPWGSDDG